MAPTEHNPQLEERRRAMIAEISTRSVGGQDRARRRQGPSASGSRLRTLLLPAFAIVLFIHFGSRAGAPLGVHAAFTPNADGVSFAGPRVFEQGAAPPSSGSVRLAPGDVVGTQTGSPTVLALGDGRVELSPGARAAVASLLPPRVRLIRGEFRAFGRLRIITAMGVVELAEGECALRLDERGLEVELEIGAGELIAPYGTVELVPGEIAASR